MPLELEARACQVPQQRRDLSSQLALPRALATHLRRVEARQPHLRAATRHDGVAVNHLEVRRLATPTFGRSTSSVSARRLGVE